MMRLFICPECGWMRTVSRRASVECFKCNGVMMQPVKLEYTQYVKMLEETPEKASKEAVEKEEKPAKEKNTSK